MLIKYTKIPHKHLQAFIRNHNKINYYEHRMHSRSLTLHINSNKQPINMKKASVNQSRSIFTKTEHDKMFRASKHFQPFQMF
jgi:hypothetical protein